MPRATRKSAVAGRAWRALAWGLLLFIIVLVFTIITFTVIRPSSEFEGRRA